MAAISYDLYIEQGATFYKKLTFKDSTGALIDLTSFTFRGQIRKTISNATKVLDFTCTVLDQVTNKGELDMSLTATQTSEIALDAQDSPTRIPQDFCYDLEKVDNVSGFVERVLEGVCSISPEVTR
jgi:hypothetical protein